MGKLNDAVTDTSEVVARIDKTSRIAAVASVIWLIVTFLFVDGSRHYISEPFNTSTFITFGILPIAAYWGWRFIKAARG